MKTYSCPLSNNDGMDAIIGSLPQDVRDYIYWASKFPDGIAVLNSENDAPTAIWLSDGVLAY